MAEWEWENENDLQYYLDTEKRDREHENSRMPISHSGIDYIRHCVYCDKPFDSLRNLYTHLKTEHPGKPLKVK